MLPSGLFAAGFLLALVPGWVYSALTDGYDTPRRRTPLQETLDLIVVGIGTSGSVAVIVGLLCPDTVIHAWAARGTASGVRQLALLALVGLAVASAIAALLAWIYRRRASTRTNVSVWRHVLGRNQVPAGHVPYATIYTTSGVMVAGVLDAYSWDADIQNRDVALKKPIQTLRAGHEAEPWPVDRVIVPGDVIEQIGLTYSKL